MPRGRKKKKLVQTEIPDTVVPEIEVDDEEEVIPESEVNAIFEKVETKKTEERKVVERGVDSQEWTRQDPEIPEALRGRVWVAVFKCSKGHKTKATNRQEESGILCFECRQIGVENKADMLAAFSDKPFDQSTKSELKRKEMNRRGRNV